MSSGFLSLARHPGSPAGDAAPAVAARVRRPDRSTLAVSYRLEGELSRLRIPPPVPARVGTGLWQHTCFEIFLRRHGMPAYHELNFSPSGEWAAYAFSGYRQAVNLEPAPPEPRVTWSGGARCLELEAIVSLEPLSLAAGTLSIGLSAVVEDAQGLLSYFALRHPQGKPDFHHPEAFALQVREAGDAVRN